MRAVVHFVKTGPHIQHGVLFVHQRNVDGRPAAVVGTNRHINHVFRVRAGIPQLSLRFLRAISVVDHQLQPGQCGDADGFRQRGGRIGMQQAQRLLINRTARDVVGCGVFQIDMQRREGLRHINQFTLWGHSSAPLTFELTKLLL